MSQEAINLLTQIRDSLASLDRNIATLVAQRRQAAPKTVASDRDLDGKFGDPVVRFMPRDWHGASFKGRHMSECPPEMLELLASTFDYFGDQAEKHNERANNGKPVADYKRSDAARARGWAKRIREGKVPQAPVTGAASGWADTETETEPESEWASGGGF